MPAPRAIAASRSRSPGRPSVVGPFGRCSVHFCPTTVPRRGRGEGDGRGRARSGGRRGRERGQRVLVGVAEDHRRPVAAPGGQRQLLLQGGVGHGRAGPGRPGRAGRPARAAGPPGDLGVPRVDQVDVRPGRAPGHLLDHPLPERCPAAATHRPARCCALRASPPAWPVARGRGAGPL